MFAVALYKPQFLNFILYLIFVSRQHKVRKVFEENLFIVSAHKSTRELIILLMQLKIQDQVDNGIYKF